MQETGVCVCVYGVRLQFPYTYIFGALIARDVYASQTNERTTREIDDSDDDVEYTNVHRSSMSE